MPASADLLVTVSILAEKKYTATFIRKFIRREMLMESHCLKNGQRKKGKKRARETMAHFVGAIGRKV